MSGCWYYRYPDGRIEKIPFDDFLARLTRDGEANFRENFRIAETLFATPEEAANPRDAIRVSTVFLSLDHALDDGPPVLYETMIFGFDEGHPLYDYQDRYTSEEDARRGHDEAVDLVRTALDPEKTVECVADLVVRASTKKTL
jgi:hypothetical protein